MDIKFNKASNLRKENKVQFDADGDSHDIILKAKDMLLSDIFVPAHEIYDFPDGEIYMCISRQNDDNSSAHNIYKENQILAYGLNHHIIYGVNIETVVIKFNSELGLIPSVSSSIILDKLTNAIQELNSLR